MQSPSLLNGLQVVTQRELFEETLVELKPLPDNIVLWCLAKAYYFFFPKRRPRTIRKVPTSNVIQMGNTLVMHPDTLDKIKKHAKVQEERTSALFQIPKLGSHTKYV